MMGWAVYAWYYFLYSQINPSLELSSNFSFSFFCKSDLIWNNINIYNTKLVQKQVFFSINLVELIKVWLIIITVTDDAGTQK
jgi:hypothetical protein